MCVCLLVWDRADRIPAVHDYLWFLEPRADGGSGSGSGSGSDTSSSGSGGAQHQFELLVVSVHLREHPKHVKRVQINSIPGAVPTCVVHLSLQTALVCNSPLTPVRCASPLAGGDVAIDRHTLSVVHSIPEAKARMEAEVSGPLVFEESDGGGDESDTKHRRMLVWSRCVSVGPSVRLLIACFVSPSALCTICWTFKRWVIIFHAIPFSRVFRLFIYCLVLSVIFWCVLQFVGSDSFSPDNIKDDIKACAPVAAGSASDECSNALSLLVWACDGIRSLLLPIDGAIGIDGWC